MLERLSAAGLRLKRDKRVFLAPEVVYVGYRINHEGTHPVADQVKAIGNALVPANQTQLKSWLGLYVLFSSFSAELCHRAGTTA